MTHQITLHRVRMTLDATYDLNGVPIQDITKLLDDYGHRAFQDGMLSGHTEAEVITYSYHCQVLPDEDIDALNGATLATVLAMADSHVEDIETGIQDGTYDPEENLDIAKKRKAVNDLSMFLDRVNPSFDAFMGIAASEITSICDRLLDSEEHATENAIPDVAEDAATVIHRLYRLLGQAESEKQNLVPQRDEAIDFVRQVSTLSKWGGDPAEAECENPSEGTDDSHECLMNLIDEARKILAT